VYVYIHYTYTYIYISIYIYTYIYVYIYMCIDVHKHTHGNTWYDVVIHGKTFFPTAHHYRVSKMHIIPSVAGVFPQKSHCI